VGDNAEKLARMHAPHPVSQLSGHVARHGAEPGLRERGRSAEHPSCASIGLEVRDHHAADPRVPSPRARRHTRHRVSPGSGTAATCAANRPMRRVPSAVAWVLSFPARAGPAPIALPCSSSRRPYGDARSCCAWSPTTGSSAPGRYPPCATAAGSRQDRAPPRSRLALPYRGGVAQSPP
jgi:hypothetical protein